MAITAAAMVGRVGGLATAVGIGAAVWTGLAAPASAAPSDSTNSTAKVDRAAVRPAAVNRGPKAPTPSINAPRAAAAVPVRNPSAPKAAVVVTPRVKAAVSASPAVAAVKPARRDVRERAIAAPARQTPTATAAPASTPTRFLEPLLSAMGISFDPRGRLITVYQGTHFAIPNNFGFFVQKVSGTGTFTGDSVYDLGDEDQYDWNKFTGIAFTPLEPDRDSVMVGWRYNLTTQEFEIAPFYNVNKERILPNENPLSPDYEVISVPVDEPFTYTVDYTGVTISYGGTTVFKPFPTGLTPNIWTAARVSGWFGGNEAAPRTLSYYIDFTA